METPYNNLSLTYLFSLVTRSATQR